MLVVEYTLTYLLGLEYTSYITHQQTDATASHQSLSCQIGLLSCCHPGSSCLAHTSSRGPRRLPVRHTDLRAGPGCWLLLLQIDHGVCDFSGWLWRMRVDWLLYRPNTKPKPPSRVCRRPHSARRLYIVIYCCSTCLFPICSC